MVDLPKTADIVVIGGGSVGTAVAYHLARLSDARVLLLEREALASGSTGRAAGMITQQFRTALQVALAKESLASFKELAAADKYGLRFHQSGYVHLLCTEPELAQARESVALQRRLGVTSQLLSPAETAAILPGLEIDDIVGATNCPEDGYTDPHLVTSAFAELAREHGARILVYTPVTALDVARGRVAAVHTPLGRVATPLVVDAAGPWAAQVAALAGLDLPVRPFRRQLWFTQAVDSVAPSAPILFDTHHDYYFRKEGAGVLMCLGNPQEVCAIDTPVDWGFAARVAEYAVHRFPPFAQAQIVSAWAAPRDMTPDHEPVLGFVPDLEGFVAAAGGSGHGFMLAPAVGRLIAELVLGGKGSRELGHLDVARFQGRRFPLSAYSPVGA